MERRQGNIMAGGGETAQRPVRGIDVGNGRQRTNPSGPATRRERVFAPAGFPVYVPAYNQMFATADFNDGTSSPSSEALHDQPAASTTVPMGNAMHPQTTSARSTARNHALQIFLTAALTALKSPTGRKNTLRAGAMIMGLPMHH